MSSSWNQSFLEQTGKTIVKVVCEWLLTKSILKIVCSVVVLVKLSKKYLKFDLTLMCSIYYFPSRLYFISFNFLWSVFRKRSKTILSFNLFVTSKKRNHEFTNSRIYQFTNLKCCKMSFKAFKMKKKSLKCFLK